MAYINEVFIPLIFSRVGITVRHATKRNISTVTPKNQTACFGNFKPVTTKLILLIAVFAQSVVTIAQTPDSVVLATNLQIDASVVNEDANMMEQLYADDFVFTHGTGGVNGKTVWIANVLNPDGHFISRTHDSTKVEMHGNVAIVTGRLDIVLEKKQQKSQYSIWYVRVFVQKANRWQLISHLTTKQSNI